jgi:hypothetical protein
VEWLKVKALSSRPRTKGKRKKIGFSWLAHTCNPSYSGGRDQEDQGFEASPGEQCHETLSQKKTKNILKAG